MKFLCLFKISISDINSVKNKESISILKGGYSILSMSRQALSKDAGSGQLCGEPVSSVRVLTCDAAVSTESAGSWFGSHPEEQLTILIMIWDSSSLPTRLGEEMGKSGEESLARSCKWS